MKPTYISGGSGTPILEYRSVEHHRSVTVGYECRTMTNLVRIYTLGRSALLWSRCWAKLKNRMEEATEFHRRT
jgi:hypothetical protein